jgi:5-methylcytosine-specific restriction enzyme subunit McrC
MQHLFEYGEWMQVDSPGDLKTSLAQLWQSRMYSSIREDREEDERNTSQPFFEFDGNRIRANNYVGFVQQADTLIEVYPKVFRSGNCQDKEMMLNHIFYWFEYCRKWKLPFSSAGLKTKFVDSFPELIIYLMASQILETVLACPYMSYTPTEESLLNPRGTINFKRYIRNSLSYARHQYVECDHEPFVFDNKLNRLIKYTVRLLSRRAKTSENVRLLESCLHLLDEVQDRYFQEDDINSISLSNYYSSYEPVLETCRLVIAQQLYSTEPFDLTQWSLLFPMEYIFEDFIAGFLEEHFTPLWKVEYQKSDAYLSDDPKVFNLQHDIFLSRGDRKIIVDTKYKMRPANFKSDPKKGVDQADMYQVVSYAVKRGCTEVFLLYPNIGLEVLKPDTFVIRPALSQHPAITVTVMEVPFWSNISPAWVDVCLKNVIRTLMRL